MAGFDHSVLTDVGWQALTDAEAGKHIEYIHLEAGDGAITGGDAEMYTMTALKHYVMDFPITSFSNDGKGQITLIGALSSKNVAAGFYFREVGVRATIDGGPSLLYAVANAGAVADFIPPSTDTSIVIQSVQIIIKIDRAANVSVIIQPGLDVTAQNIGPGTVGPGWFRDKIGQILWFKRAVQGKIMKLTETADTVTIENTGADTAVNLGTPTSGSAIFTNKDANGILSLRRINSPKKTLLISEQTNSVDIDLRQVTQNLDMWVALGNPDIFPNFSTIANALAYLRPYSVDPDITVTIHVAAGTWMDSPTIYVNHPEGNQVQIIGTLGTQKNVTNVTYQGGGLILLNAPAGTFSDMNVGDWFRYYNTNSVEGMCISGVYPVSARAANGSYIQYAVSFYGPFPNLALATGGAVLPIKTIIRSRANNTAMLVVNSGLGMAKNMVFVAANRAGAGIQCQRGVTNVDMCGAYGYQAGFQSSFTGSLFCSSCSANCGGDGFVSYGLSALTDVYVCFANSNQYYGIRGESAQMTANTGIACGCSVGLVVSDHGHMTFDNCYAIRNQSFGIYSTFHSHASGSGAGGYYATNANTDVVLSVQSGLVRAAGGGHMSYGTANIAPQVLSWDGCFFTP